MDSCWCYYEREKSPPPKRRMLTETESLIDEILSSHDANTNMRALVQEIRKESTENVEQRAIERVKKTFDEQVKEIKRILAELEDSCVICLDATAIICINPCKHTCMCAICYEAWKGRGTCPICRGRIENI